MTKRYLIFDAGCSTCSQLAEAVEQAAGGKLEAVSIGGAGGRAVLDRALPRGWKHAPYLAVENGNSVSAWTGIGAALRLGLLLGPRKAWHVWSLANRLGVPLPPGSTTAAVYDASRRRFLRVACAMAGGLAAVGFQGASMVFACDECNCCGSGGCGPCSSQLTTCYQCPSCSGPPPAVYRYATFEYYDCCGCACYALTDCYNCCNVCGC